MVTPGQREVLGKLDTIAQLRRKTVAALEATARNLAVLLPHSAVQFGKIADVVARTRDRLQTSREGAELRSLTERADVPELAERAYRTERPKRKRPRRGARGYDGPGLGGLYLSLLGSLGPLHVIIQRPPDLWLDYEPRPVGLPVLFHFKPRSFLLCEDRACSTEHVPPSDAVRITLPVKPEEAVEVIRKHTGQKTRAAALSLLRREHTRRKKAGDPGLPSLPR